MTFGCNRNTGRRCCEITSIRSEAVDRLQCQLVGPLPALQTLDQARMDRGMQSYLLVEIYVVVVPVHAVMRYSPVQGVGAVIGLDVACDVPRAPYRRVVEGAPHRWIQVITPAIGEVLGVAQGMVRSRTGHGRVTVPTPAISDASVPSAINERLGGTTRVLVKKTSPLFSLSHSQG